MKISVAYGVRNKDCIFQSVFSHPNVAHEFLRRLVNRDDTVLFDYTLSEGDDDQAEVTTDDKLC